MFTFKLKCKICGSETIQFNIEIKHNVPILKCYCRDCGNIEMIHANDMNVVVY